MARPFVLPPGEGRAIDLGSFAMSVKATAEETSGRFSLLEATEPPGFGPPIHVHRDADEAFYVLQGEYIILIDGREEICPAGSFVFIPAGVEHGFRVGEHPGKKLNLYAPAAMVGYFDELAAGNRQGELTPEDLGDIARKYSMDVVGPVPDSYT
jgi:quercetin dioxygenase-like cupin family protein